MTFLPAENRDVVGLQGPQFPRYRVGPVCCVPGCSKFADHAHHLWRRSFIGGDFAWVELWNHKIVGNLVGICFEHHRQITENEMWLMWRDSTSEIVWADNKKNILAAIFPQPPQHGAPSPLQEESVEPGPAAQTICPGCGRPKKLPRVEGEASEPARRRKTWTVTVPDDAAEDGALVLDTLMEECRELFAHGEEKNVRYFTLVQALALVVQNGHLLK